MTIRFLSALALLCALPALPAPGLAQSGTAADPEKEFARYDVTGGGWLSGTELDACACRLYDVNGNGEVSKAEFIAGRVMAEAGLPPLKADTSSAPASPAARPSQAARPSPAATARASAAPSVVGPRLARYTILSYGYTGQPPIRLGTVELQSSGTYRRYDGGGRPLGAGRYAFEAVSSTVRWQTGPLSGPDWGGDFTVERAGKTHKIRLKRSTIAVHSTD